MSTRSISVILPLHVQPFDSFLGKGISVRKVGLLYNKQLRIPVQNYVFLFMHYIFCIYALNFLNYLQYI